MLFRYKIYIFPAALVLLLGSITGCKVGPKYTRPEVVKSTQFRFSGSSDTVSLADLEWVTLFRDTVLQRLVNTGLKNNPDMQIAFARIEEARANFKVARGQQWPMLSISGSAGTSQSANPLSSGTIKSDQYNAYAGLSWELDIWGKLRSAKEAARANLFAQEAYQQSVRIILINDIASSYFNLLEYDNETRITQENIIIRQKSLDLVRAKLIAGTASGLVVAQAEAELAVAKTQVPRLEMLIGIEENYLSTLLGDEPHAIFRGRPMLDQVNPPMIKTTGIPSRLITRRPDIIMAEQNLVAANANIGVARAKMLPTVSISGLIGSAFSPTNLIYSAVADLIAPVFQGGTLRSNVKVAEAKKQQLLFTYQKTIYNSLKEVSDAILQVQKMRDIVVSQQETERAAQTAFDLSNQLYNAGYASYLDVINAQSMLFDSQINLSMAQSDELTAMIGLYTALGGGWR